MISQGVKAQQYAMAISIVDNAIANILQTLEYNDLYNNSYILFT